MIKLAIVIFLFITASVTFADDVVWRVAPPFALMPGGGGPEGSETAKKQMPQEAKEETTPKQDQEQPKPAPLNTNQSAASDQHSGHDSKRNVNPNEKPSEWTAVAIIGIVLGVGGLFFGYRQVYYAKRADRRETHSVANTADASLIERQKERAYLAVESLQVDRQFKGSPPPLSCVLLNSGRTPAKVVGHGARTVVGKVLPPLPDYQQLPPKGQEHLTIGAGRDVVLETSPHVEPGLSPEQVESAVDAGTLLTLYFYGVVVYTDVFGLGHETAFFARYDPWQDILLAVNEPGYNYST